MVTATQENHTFAFRRIGDELRGEIRSGRLKAGAMIPSRRALAEEYGVTVATVQRAITVLVDEGLLAVDDRRGTFVNGIAHAGSRRRNLRLRKHSQAEQVREATVAASGRPVIGIVTLWPVGSTPGEEGGGDSWESYITHSLESCVSSAHGATRFATLLNDEVLTSTPEQLVETIERMGCDVTIVIDQHIDIPLDGAACRLLRERRLKVVCVRPTRLSSGSQVSVTWDNVQAGYMVANHLLEECSDAIALLAPFTSPWLEERTAGIRMAIREHGLPSSALTILTGGEPRLEMPPDAAGRHLFDRAMGAGLNFSAVVAFNDNCAYGFMDAAAERGLLAGNDYTIAGFDDRAASKARGLTSVRPPLLALGREAAKLALRIARGAENIQEVRLNADLIVRGSTHFGLPDR